MVGVYYENIWKYMKIYENIWKYMKIYENIWKYMKIYENIWKYERHPLLKSFELLQKLCVCVKADGKTWT